MRPGEKVELVEVATGTRIERWPVDAKELVASGEYAFASDANAVTLPVHVMQDAEGNPLGASEVAGADALAAENAGKKKKAG